MTLAPLPPYALAPSVFPFRHLAGLAGRAPIGGAREVALACFVAARLAADHDPTAVDGETARASRCAGAKTWLGSLALPSPVRTSVTRCADASAYGEREDLARELATLAIAAAAFLDAPSRHELEALIASFRG